MAGEWPSGTWKQMERLKARRALEEDQYEHADRFWRAPKPSLEIFGQRIRHGRQQAG